MHIRRYIEDDTLQLIEIYHNTIHNVNCADYTPAELEAWAPTEEITDESYAKDVIRWSKIRPFVVVENDEIMGFAELEDKGHINLFFVNHLCQGKGVGSMLINACIKEGKRLSYDKLFAEVSITAKPFFLHKGFLVIRPVLCNISGFQMKYYDMELDIV